jgi:hypothetical protein
VIRFVGGTFYGPGGLADAPSPPGQLRGLELTRGISGEIGTSSIDSMTEEAAAAPKGPPTAVLSNGHPVNPNMEGGVVEVGRGAMRFHELVPLEGPGGGTARFTLDSDLMWHLVVDLVLDPGFPEGMVSIEALDITSGAAWVPQSLQTRGGLIGGTDRAGSLDSGVPVVGHVGDDDGDGYLDGLIVGATNMPLQHIFLPGSPTVQSRSFTTDIPISALDAALLSVASALTYRDVFRRLQERPSPAPAAEKDLQRRLLTELSERIDAGLRALKRDRHGAAYESGLSAARAGVSEIRQDMERSDVADDASLQSKLERVFAELHTLRGKLAQRTALR